jgi:hypothetical protein
MCRAIGAALVLLAGCEAGPGGLSTLQHYAVDVSITDALAERALTFDFLGSAVTRPQDCGSLTGANVRFAGNPVALSRPGGWVKQRLPTNTAPGETVNADHCEKPWIALSFGLPKGEQQNGTLEIEGAGLRFAVPVNHLFGNPDVSLVSAVPEKVLLQVEGFPVLPALDTITVDFTPTVSSSTAVIVQKVGLSAEGLLELSLPANASQGGGLRGWLSVSVDLGGETIQCLGFVGCKARSRVSRSILLDVPPP